MTSPPGRTTCSALTQSEGTPYFTQHRPPALVATFPPIEQISNDDGSGGYPSPSWAAAALTSLLKAPGSTTATWHPVSISMSVIRSRLSTSPPSTALAPPDRPLPAPRGTTGTPCAVPQRRAVCTGAASSAGTTAIGVPADGSCDQSWRYFSTASAPVTTTSPGNAVRSSSRASMGPCNHAVVADRSGDSRIIQGRVPTVVPTNCLAGRHRPGGTPWVGGPGTQEVLGCRTHVCCPSSRALCRGSRS